MNISARLNETRRKFSGLTTNLLLLIVVLYIDSSFNYGYNTTNIVPMRPFLAVWIKNPEDDTVQNSSDINEPADHDFDRGSAYEGFFNSFRWLEGSIHIGGIIGSILAFNISVHFGRKGGFMLSTFLNITAILFSGYSKYFSTPSFLFIGRFLMGIKCGITMVVAPIYITEVTPQNIRAYANVGTGLFFSIGVFLGRGMSWYLGNSNSWPLVFSLSVITSFPVLIFLPSCPESPKYLYIFKGNELECKRALIWLRGTHYIDEDVDSIKYEYFQYRQYRKTYWQAMVEHKIVRHVLLVNFLLFLSRHLCGFFSIAPYLHRLVHFHLVVQFMIFIILGFVSMAMVNVFSRRVVLMSTFVIMAIACLAIVFMYGIRKSRVSQEMEVSTINTYIILTAIIIHLSAYRIGIGTLTWVIPPEICPTPALAYVYSVGMAFGSLVRFIIAVAYYPMLNYMGYIIFLNPFLFNLIYAYLVYDMVPDTRHPIRANYLWIYERLKKKREFS